MLTFSARVPGPLTPDAKQRSDSDNDGLGAFGIDPVEPDHRPRTYGPDAGDTRPLLRRATAAAVADTGPREPPPPGRSPRFGRAPRPPGVASVKLGGMLADVDAATGRLVPRGAPHRRSAARGRDRGARAIQERWRRAVPARSPVAWPFRPMPMPMPMPVPAAWLAIVFATLGPASPRGRPMHAVAGSSALPTASPPHRILDHGDAMTAGWLRLSGVALRAAPSHMPSHMGREG